MPFPGPDSEPVDPQLSLWAETGLDDQARDQLADATLLISWPVHGDSQFGTRSDMDVRHRVEDLLNAALHPHDLGQVDGGAFGAGSMEIFVDIDPDTWPTAWEAVRPVLHQESILSDGGRVTLHLGGHARPLWPPDNPAVAPRPGPAAADPSSAPASAPQPPPPAGPPQGPPSPPDAPHRLNPVPNAEAPPPPAQPRPSGPPPRTRGRPGLRLGSGPGLRPAHGRSGPRPRRAPATARGPLTLARSNLQVLEVLARLDPGQPLHPGQRAVLEQWAGWGLMAKAFDPYERTPAWQQLGARLRELLTPEEGTAAQQATATSFYTSPTVTSAIWRVLVGLGLDGGQVLEPGCGSGLFIAATPASLPVDWTGVERDPVSARIAALLHPGARIITAPLERVSLPPASFAAACGNVPFADVTPYDPTAPKKLSLHNYFIWRAVQAVHPGGLVAVVTSRFTLDGEEPRARELLAEDADLVGAVRLPSGAFREYGTDVVADILVLRRRTSPPAEGAAPGWLAASRQPQLRTSVNGYFLSHPEQVLGHFETAGGAYHGQVLDVVFDGDRDREFEAALTAAIERIVAAGVQQRHTYTPRRDPTTIPDDIVLVDKAGRKDGSFHLVNDVVHQVTRGRLVRVPRAGAELRALIGLRDAIVALLDAEADPDATDRVLAPLRATLNRRYDRYVATYGPLNRCKLIQGPPDEDTGLPTWSRRRPPMGGFRDDPDYVTVLALELYDDDTRTATKAPIFQQRVNRRPQRPERARDAADAVALCLDEHGHLDVATIARLLAISPGQVPGALGDLAYLDPAEQRWVPADEYLSGDVREKLEQARAAAARNPARYADHVARLQAVQPTDLGPEQIRAKLGVPWVEARDIQAFLTETLGGQGVSVRHEPLTATWEVKVDSWTASSAAATAEWGTGRITAYELVQLACNGGAPVIYDQVEGPNGHPVDVKNIPETMLAEAKLQALNERFATWLWEDPERTDRLVAVYNRRYNAVVLRRFDGSHLTFPGMAEWFTPYSAQRDIVYRIAATPAALCGFAVGGGKTAAMFMAAITLRRLGLAAKPMIVCPNHLLEQTAQEGKRLFPGAKILMASSEDVDKEHRKRFAARCAVGDWDAVVITQSAFTALRVHPDTEAVWLADQIELYRQAAMALAEGEERSSRTVKQIAKQADRLEARQRELLDRRTDDGVTFEQLGVDYLLVDEAHYYKRLGFPTRMEGFSVEASTRATDLALKLWWLRGRTPGERCGAFFTGTPISNSLAELYVVLTYLMPDRLATLRIDSFDAFAGMFIEFRTQIEVDVSGASFRLHRRPAKFINVPELRMLLGEVADIRTRQTLGLATPNAEFTTVVVPAPAELRAFVATLVSRADKIRAGGVDRKTDNMLAVCNDGRAAALDLALVGIHTDDPGKVDAVVEKVAAIWRQTADNRYPSKDGDPSPIPGALQVVFCDLGTPNRKKGTQVYGKIRRGLIAAGIPAARIRWVHSAKTDTDKAALFADCRAGRVSVLLGSTDKLGVGTNIQDRCVALHDVDAPYRPTDLEQRHGRGLRPGNHNRRVRINRYVSQGSFDSYMWQMLERKAAFIAQILTGELTAREVEDVDPVALSYAEVKALATGQPLLLEAASVAAEIARLRNLAAGHTRAQRRIQDDIHQLLRQAETLEEQACGLDAVAEHAGRHDPVFSRYGSGPLAERAAIAKALAGAAAEALRLGSAQYPGQWAGLRLTITPTRVWGDAALEVTATAGYRHSASFELPKSWLQQGQQWRIVAALEQLVETAPARAAELRATVAANRARAADSKLLLGRPFEHADTLQAALARQQEIEAAMRADAQAAANPQTRPAPDATAAVDVLAPAG
jgi:N12 class adenine-specific DNA methylase